MIIQSKWLFDKVLKGYAGIMILGFLFVKNSDDKELINHEKIHIRQMFEILIIGFYIWYCIEFVFRLVQYRNLKDAYKNISFEREAYRHEMNFNYLRDRKFFRFLKYL